MMQDVTQCQLGCNFFPGGMQHFAPDLVYSAQMNQ